VLLLVVSVKLFCIDTPPPLGSGSTEGMGEIFNGMMGKGGDFNELLVCFFVSKIKRQKKT